MSYQDKLKEMKRKKQDTDRSKKDMDMQTDIQTNTVEEEKEVQEVQEQFIKDDNMSPEKQIKDITSILDEESLNNLASLGFSIVKTAELKAFTEANMQLMQTAQNYQSLSFKHSVLLDRVRELKKLISKFYQMEAITLASREALQAMLKCFEGVNQGPQGWPTLQVFTPEGWIKGSVDYNLHNAVLLARSATTSENLKVVEKHIGGFNKQIKALNQDISDLQNLVPFKVEKCSHCSKFKKVNSKCSNCGRSESDEMDFLDEDDEE